MIVSPAVADVGESTREAATTPSCVFFQFDGPSGGLWKKWNNPMKNALVDNQNKKATGCKYGSWEPIARWCGEGGRVYGTAINALTLEVYYRYANVFGGGSK